MVNGKKVYELGVRVDPLNDRISVQGKPLNKAQDFVYYAFHKPKSVVTTMDDPLERPTVGEYIKCKERVFPVGRLDWDTEGLLLMTNDGHFAQKVSHPKNEILKTYLVKLNDHAEQARLDKLKKGVSIVGGKVRAHSVEIIPMGKSKKYDWVKISIGEGKNRQVRKMFEKIGYDVMKLKRTSIGNLRLGSLKVGDHKLLTQKDLDKIFQDPVLGSAKKTKRVTPISKKAAKKVTRRKKTRKSKNRPQR